MNAAKRVELPVELLVLAQRTVVVGAAVVGAAVVGVAVVLAPGQPVHSHRPMQVLKIGHAYSLSLRL